MMEFILNLLIYVILYVSIFLSVCLILFGLPGTFLIAGIGFLYGYLTQFAEITATFCAFLLGAALLGEVIEFFLGAAAAKKYGGSKQSMWGAISGGFAGAIVATSFLPIIGTFIGAFIGAFLGASLFELLSTSNVDSALRVGYGAMLGAISGKLMKITLGITMAVVLIIRIHA